MSRYTQLESEPISCRVGLMGARHPGQTIAVGHEYRRFAGQFQIIQFAKLEIRALAGP
jgi:hypothetical protein